MIQSEAKRRIYQRWLALEEDERHDENCGITLYSKLTKEGSHLIRFRYSGDKYQCVNGWVINWQNQHPKGHPV